MYFIDIETVPEVQLFSKLEPGKREAFIKRHESDIVNEMCGEPEISREIAIPIVWSQKAAFYAEFGKIVCVCVGRIKDNELHIRTLCSRFEKTILEKLSQIIDPGKTVPLCAHNGKDFDFPFLLRRYIIHGLPIPSVLNTFGKKPWETQLHDTLELWSGTQWKHRVSLDLLCNCLGLESPKQGMDGSKVAEVYYGMFDGLDETTLPFDKETEALGKIGQYCQGDVTALARAFCRMNGTPLPEKIVILENT